MPAVIAGMSRLKEQLNQVGLAFTVNDLAEGAAIILAQAQELCPVDTGFLQSTGFMQVTSSDVEIGFAAEYASFVEFGTFKMAAQPFLRPALDIAEDAALSAIVDSVTANMRDITK